MNERSFKLYMIDVRTWRSESHNLPNLLKTNDESATMFFLLDQGFSVTRLSHVSYVMMNEIVDFLSKRFYIHTVSGWPEYLQMKGRPDLVAYRRKTTGELSEVRFIECKSWSSYVNTCQLFWITMSDVPYYFAVLETDSEIDLCIAKNHKTQAERDAAFKRIAEFNSGSKV